MVVEEARLKFADRQATTSIPAITPFKRCYVNQREEKMGGENEHRPTNNPPKSPPQVRRRFLFTGWNELCFHGLRWQECQP
jgi:hypothetical protein